MDNFFKEFGITREGLVEFEKREDFIKSNRVADSSYELVAPLYYSLQTIADNIIGGSVEMEIGSTYVAITLNAGIVAVLTGVSLEMMKKSMAIADSVVIDANDEDEDEDENIRFRFVINNVFKPIE